MKVLIRAFGESWRETIARLIAEALGEDSLLDVNEALEEYDAMVEQGEPEYDVAWFVAESYGLLGKIDSEDLVQADRPSSRHVEKVTPALELVR